MILFIVAALPCKGNICILSYLSTSNMSFSNEIRTVSKKYYMLLNCKKNASYWKSCDTFKQVVSYIRSNISICCFQTTISMLWATERVRRHVCVLNIARIQNHPGPRHRTASQIFNGTPHILYTIPGGGATVGGSCGHQRGLCTVSCELHVLNNGTK